MLFRSVNDSRPARQRHGLCRTLVANMVEGVSTGFQKKLEIQGVGYRAAVDGRILVLNVGYSLPVKIDPPAGITIEVPKEKNTSVTISGIDKELVLHPRKHDRYDQCARRYDPLYRTNFLPHDDAIC